MFALGGILAFVHLIIVSICFRHETPLRALKLNNQKFDYHVWSAFSINYYIILYLLYSDLSLR
jgi:hypothetical protein